LQPTIPFEIHLTVESLNTDGQEKFAEFCLKHDAKPLLIELARGDNMQQPMLTKVIYTESLDDVLKISTRYSNLLRQNSFKVNRLKIETMPEYATLFDDGEAGTFAKYYEWHGKINYERPVELLALCEKHKAHLSINALKNTPNIRFITLREFGDNNTFNTRIKELTTDITAGGWQLLKQQSEYCIYDNNCFLDNGWLTL
jgi:hypothetical protein